MKGASILVFCAVAAVLALRSGHVRIADTLLDPLSRIDAQDEALYANGAIRMVEKGDWFTPRFLGRYSLVKPPLLEWLAAASAWLLGVSAFALRFPVILAAAGTAWLVFRWLRRLDSRFGAVAGVLLLVSNRMWLVVSSLCLTDSLLAAAITGAVYCLYRDSRLEARRAFWGFAGCTAAALLVKGIAGLLPLLILAAFCALARKGRPPLRRVVQVCGATAAMALPWALYQLAVHPRWFWSEQVVSEIFRYGWRSPLQTSAENPLLFYLRRLIEMDPVLVLGAAAAIFSLWRALRARETSALLLSLWTAAVLGAALAWSYRNATYLAPALPALAILAAGYGIPAAGRRRSAAAIAALGALLLVKLAFPAKPWGLDLRPGILHASLAALDEYCARNRGNELILVEPADGFYSAVLPLARVRYGFVAASGEPPEGDLDFRSLGIVATLAQFNDIGKWEPVFRRRLREWGLDSSEPIATAILARDRGEIVGMVRAHPQSDFLLPDSYRNDFQILGTHDAAEGAGGFFFLLAGKAMAAPPRRRACTGL